MTDWVEANLTLLRSAYNDLEYLVAEGAHWVRIPAYRMPAGLWTENAVDVAFRIPDQAGEAPYGFWVRPNVSLASGGVIQNYTFPAHTPWGDDWGQFSFAPSEPWQPKADVRAGPNMLNFARGVADRLAEGA